MKLLCLMKAVPAAAGVIESSDRQATELIPNPADISALEEALCLRDRFAGSTITIMTMGAAICENMLRQGLARGADEAVILTDPAFAGADTAATSRTLAAAIEYMGGYDLIFCGRKTTDGETGQVGPELAARLGIPSAVNCTEIMIQGNQVLCTCLTDGGVMKICLPIPSIFTFVYGINSPRLPSLMGLYSANRIQIQRLDSEKLGLKSESCGLQGSPTRVLKSYKTPFEKRRPLRIEMSKLEVLTEIIRQYGKGENE